MLKGEFNWIKFSLQHSNFFLPWPPCSNRKKGTKENRCAKCFKSDWQSNHNPFLFSCIVQLIIFQCWKSVRGSTKLANVSDGCNPQTVAFHQFLVFNDWFRLYIFKGNTPTELALQDSTHLFVSLSVCLWFNFELNVWGSVCILNIFWVIKN